ncbi:MAG: lysylphosphatidylglycerol synthase transmembrane domain-containing protein [Bacteroidota bacterium]
MKTPYKIALVAIVLLCFGFFIRATNWAGVLEAVQKVGINFLFLIFVTYLSAWTGVLGWRYCLPKDTKQVSSFQLFWIRMIGENFAILNPTSMIGGEAAKIYMLTDLGVNRRQALHSIILSRAIMIISQIFMLSLACISFLSLSMQTFSWPHFEWLRIGGGVVLMLGLAMALRGDYVRKGVKKLFLRLRLMDFYRRACTFLAELWLELRAFYRGNRRAMFMSFLFCCLHWIVGSLEFYFILLFLGIKTTVFKALLVDMGVIVFKTAGAFIPGQIGIEEYGNKVMLSIIGIAGDTIWITVSILRRSRQLFWIIVGLLMYFIRFHGKPAILPLEDPLP